MVRKKSRRSGRAQWPAQERLHFLKAPLHEGIGAKNTTCCPRVGPARLNLVKGEVQGSGVGPTAAEWVAWKKGPCLFIIFRYGEL